MFIVVLNINAARRLNGLGLAAALMPNENLSGEWTPGRGGDQGDQGRGLHLKLNCSSWKGSEGLYVEFQVQADQWKS